MRFRVACAPACGRPEPSADSEKAMPAAQRAVLDCSYARHPDSRVRQRRLERVVGLVEPWVAPFVVQLRCVHRAGSGDLN